MNGDWYGHALALGAALACGLLIGIERGFNLRDRASRASGLSRFWEWFLASAGCSEVRVRSWQQVH